MDLEANDEPVCSGCQVLVMEPYIQCNTCVLPDGEGERASICLHCFAKGVEFEGHESDHPYCVVVSVTYSLVTEINKLPIFYLFLNDVVTLFKHMRSQKTSV